MIAYVPFLEVLPEHRGRGIGTGLMRRLLARLQGLYMIDLPCDPALRPFYARERYDDRLHYPTLDDFARALSREPGMPDLRLPEHRALLDDLARRHRTADGDYVVHRRYVVWAASTQ